MRVGRNLRIALTVQLARPVNRLPPFPNYPRTRFSQADMPQ